MLVEVKASLETYDKVTSVLSLRVFFFILQKVYELREGMFLGLDKLAQKGPKFTRMIMSKLKQASVNNMDSTRGADRVNYEIKEGSKRTPSC